MRIGINLLSWVPGRRGGVETYDRNLLAALLQLDGPDEYVVFVGREAAGALGLADPGCGSGCVRSPARGGWGGPCGSSSDWRESCSERRWRCSSAPTLCCPSAVRCRWS